MRGGGVGLFMALAVLGPRASAQPNAPLSRTPASPIVVAQNAAKAYWERSVRDHDLSRVPQKRELTHELAAAYDCSASGSECQSRMYMGGSYSTKWVAEDACNYDLACVAYDWSETQSLGFMCSATTPRSDEYNEYVMCTKLPPPPPPMPPTPPPPLCPQGSGTDEVGLGEVGDSPMDRAQICSLCEFGIYDNDAPPGDWWFQKDYLNCDAMPNCIKAWIRACADADSSVSLPPSACEKAEQITAEFGWVAPELNGFDFNQLAGCAPRPARARRLRLFTQGSPSRYGGSVGGATHTLVPRLGDRLNPALPCAFFTCVAPCIAGAPSGLVAGL